MFECVGASISRLPGFIVSRGVLLVDGLKGETLLSRPQNVTQSIVFAYSDLFYDVEARSQWSLFVLE